MPSSQPDNETPDERASDKRFSAWKDAISRAMRGDFGPPGESLRSDIMDELADHLSESMKREERAGRNESDARERVLKRFGSPSQIAARLWFDGMKGSIMFQRWMMGTLTVMMLIGFAVCAVAFWSIRETNVALQSTMNELTEQIETTASRDWVTVPFRCVDEKHRKPIAGVKLILNGLLISADFIHMSATTDESGFAKIGPIRPGKHQLNVSLENRWNSHSNLTVFPGSKSEVTIVCPNNWSSSGPVTLSLPKVDRPSNVGVRGWVELVHSIDDRKFYLTFPHQNILVLDDGTIFPICDDKSLRTENAGIIGEMHRVLTLPYSNGQFRFLWKFNLSIPLTTKLKTGDSISNFKIISRWQGDSMAAYGGPILIHESGDGGKPVEWTILPDDFFSTHTVEAEVPSSE
ncbi:permease prefix domain 1-containing protein [bacterium]|nr:permease prefix domain 1-containing protein [bacterium]